MTSDISYIAGSEENTIKVSDWNGTTVTKDIQLKMSRQLLLQTYHLVWNML